MNATDALYDDIYTPAVVMARVGHLDRSKRQDVEHVTRIIREGFNGAGALCPMPKITRILLIGTYAKRTRAPDADTSAIPNYGLWIIVNDRLLTHRRLWQATKARIEAELDKCCTVNLSFATARGVKAGKRSGDDFVTDRLRTGITLYRAKRDAPTARCCQGKAVWADALSCLDAATAAFAPASDRFRAAEAAQFASRSQSASGHVDFVPLDGYEVKRADEEQSRCGAALHEATMALIHTPAPDLAAVIRKVELVRDTGDGDDHSTISILSDLRWIAAQLAVVGKSS